MIMNDLKQRAVRVAAVDEALKLLLVESGIDVLFVAVLLDFDRTGCANHAAVKNLKQLRMCEQRLAHLRTGGVFDYVGNAGVCIQGQVTRQVLSCHHEHPLLVRSIIERFESATDSESVIFNGGSN